MTEFRGHRIPSYYLGLKVHKEIHERLIKRGLYARAYRPSIQHMLLMFNVEIETTKTHTTDGTLWSITTKGPVYTIIVEGKYLSKLLNYTVNNLITQFLKK